MRRILHLVCGLAAAALCHARPVIVAQSQIIDPPAETAYVSFGDHVAIDGDWALVSAYTAYAPGSPSYFHDALLYRRVNGSWVFDRVLLRLSSDEAGVRSIGPVAMSNGLAAITAWPTRTFRRTGTTWAEIPNPFTTARPQTTPWGGAVVWDGTTLLASDPTCDWWGTGSWGAWVSTYDLATSSWSPLERIQNPGYCDHTPEHWGLSGNTAVAGAWSNDHQSEPDRQFVFRRTGATWTATSNLHGGAGQGDVRGDEIFHASYAAQGPTRVYRNDDSGAVVDFVGPVNAAYRENGDAWGFAHTNEFFLQSYDVFRKNAAGKYEHAAILDPVGPYSLSGDAKISGRRVISRAWRSGSDANQVVAFFDLPTALQSDVISTGFADGTSPFAPQLGAFAVATTASGNRVYRQSSVAGDHRALLGDAAWTEQSIEADITPTAFNGADRWVGLAVRYRDDANHYYVTLRSSGVISLRRKRDGAYVALAQQALPVVAGRRYRVGLQAYGSRVAVRIDGREVLAVDDPQPLASGRTALVGYRAAVDYDNVVAAEIGLQPIYDHLHGSCYGSMAYWPWSMSGSGTWTCSDTSGTKVIRQVTAAGDARAMIGTPTDDQIVSTRARITGFGAGTNHWFGVAARYVDASNHYYLTLRTSNVVSLRKVVNGAITELGAATLTVTPNTWYDLRIDAVGNELRAFVNGTQLFQVTDASHARGQGGLLMYRAAAEYSNYLAWQP
jgi:hypothetical protein